VSYIKCVDNSHVFNLADFLIAHKTSSEIILLFITISRNIKLSRNFIVREAQMKNYKFMTPCHFKTIKSWSYR